MFGSTTGADGGLLATAGFAGRLARLTGFEGIGVDFEGIGAGFGRVALAGRSGAFVGCVNRRGVLESALEISSSAFRLTETLGSRWTAGAGLSEGFPPVI